MLHLESYLVYEKEHKVGHCHQSCLLLFFFVVSTLKECKIFDFLVFVGISFAIAFKIRKLDYGWNRITSRSTLCKIYTELTG